MGTEFCDPWGPSNGLHTSLGHPTRGRQLKNGVPVPLPADPWRRARGKQDAACEKRPGRQLAAAQGFVKPLKPTRQNRTGQRVQPKSCCFFTSPGIAQYEVNQIIELHKQQPS